MTVRLEQDRPAVRLAYEFICPSYDWAISRWDAMHGRVVQLLTYAAALMVGAPAIARAVSPSSIGNRNFLIGAGIAFLILTIIGLTTLRIGKLQVLDLRAIYTDSDWIDSPEAEFKTDLLDMVSLDFKENLDEVDRKAIGEFSIIVLLGLQVVFLVLWLVL